MGTNTKTRSCPRGRRQRENRVSLCVHFHDQRLDSKRRPLMKSPDSQEAEADQAAASTSLKPALTVF